MKTVVILEQPEIDAVFSDEGFTLVLANGQRIVIQAEGEKAFMSDGEIQVLMVKVRGDGETVRAGMERFSDLVKQVSKNDPPPAPVVTGNGATAGELLRTVADLPTAVAPAPRLKPARVVDQHRAARPGHWGCEVEGCGRVFATQRALGAHRKTHGVAPLGRTRVTVKLPAGERLPCGANGCLTMFRSANLREIHWRRAHPKDVNQPAAR